MHSAGFSPVCTLKCASTPSSSSGSSSSSSSGNAAAAVAAANFTQMTRQWLPAAVHMRMLDKKTYHPRDKAATAIKHTPHKVYKWLEYLSHPKHIAIALKNHYGLL